MSIRLFNLIAATFIALFLSSTFTATAQTKGKNSNNSEKLTVYPWPLTKRPPLTLSPHQEYFDGLPYHYYLLENEELKFTIKMELPPRWRATTPTSVESFAMAEQGNPKNRLSFSIFKKDEFLPDFDSKTLLGYIESLKAKYGQRLTVLNEKTNFNPQNQPFILNDNYRFIEYKVSQGNKQSFLYREFILFPKTNEKILLIIQHSGPAERVEQTAPHVMSYLYNTSLITPENK